MENTELIQHINTDMELALPLSISFNDLQSKLSGYINNLINNDFGTLLRLLYKIDVNEEKLKKLLQQKAGENAADIIALLIIERQQQKMTNKKVYSKKPFPPGNEEKW